MATNKQTANNFQTVTVPAITATSNKVSDEFKNVFNQFGNGNTQIGSVGTFINK